MPLCSVKRGKRGEEEKRKNSRGEKMRGREVEKR
jgi:hypothetical protein